MSTSIFNRSYSPSRTTVNSLYKSHVQFHITLGDATIILPGDTVVDFVRSDTSTICQAEFKPGNTGPSPSDRQKPVSGWSRFRFTAKSKSEGPELTVPGSLFLTVPSNIIDVGSIRFESKGKLEIRGTEGLGFNLFGVKSTGDCNVVNSVKADWADLRTKGTMTAGDLDAKSYQIRGSEIDVGLVYPERPGSRSDVDGTNKVKVNVSAPKGHQISSSHSEDEISKGCGIISRFMEVISWGGDTIVNKERCNRAIRVGWRAFVDNP